MWHCDHCRREWETADDQAAFFHKCPGPPPRRWDSRTSRERLADEWRNRPMQFAIEAAVGEAVWLDVEESA